MWEPRDQPLPGSFPKKDPGYEVGHTPPPHTPLKFRPCMYNKKSRSRGEYSSIITEPEANICLSIFAQVFCVFWDWIYFNFAYLFISNIHKTASPILQISVLLYSPVGKYNSLIRKQFDQSTCTICYIHLCKNTKNTYSVFEYLGMHYCFVCLISLQIRKIWNNKQC
jgi:hypothetical protein